MIQNEDYWCVDINDDDIYQDEFIALSIVETSDLALPICSLRFQTQRWEKVQQYTTPGFKVSVGVGRTSIETSCSMKVFKKKVATYRGNNRWLVDIWLSYDSMDYYNVHRTNVYNSHSDLQSSSDVVTTLTSRIGFTQDLEVSDDKMLWLQYNISDRRFLEEVVTHGWFGEQKPAMYAARRDGLFIYKPVTSLLKPRFSFGHGEVDIPVEDLSLTEKDGFLSAWIGKERILPFHSWEKGLNEQEINTPDQHMSGFIGMDDTTKYAPIGSLNDNMHENWLKAESQNFQGRASLSAVTTDIILHKEYKDIYVLDCLEGLFIKPETQETILPFMGSWLVTKVIHTVMDNHYSCTMSISREGLLES